MKIKSFIIGMNLFTGLACVAESVQHPNLINSLIGVLTLTMAYYTHYTKA